MRFLVRHREPIKLAVISIFLIIAIVLTSGCQPAEEPVLAGNDSRYMDRKIYLSDPNLDDPNRNSFFQKEKLKEAMNEIAVLSGLGSNYFTFEQVPESDLEPVTVSDPNSPQVKSFILIWPDATFNAYAATKYNSVIPDLNAITVVNEANKKQFYIIIRSSCFEIKANCSNISTLGFKALIARQLGLLVGLNFSCINPQNTMCANPSDTQWSEVNRFNFSRDFLNQLSAIDATPGFYNQ